MKNFFKNKMLKRTRLGLSLALVIIAGVFVNQASAVAIYVTGATGGEKVSIDTTSAGGTGAWTTLTRPLILEDAVGMIGAGEHVLTLPAGWEFNTAQPVTITILSLNEKTELNLSSGTIMPSATTISFNVSATSTSVSGALNFSGIQVRPTGTVPSTGNIAHQGVISRLPNSTNFGALNTVPGAATQYVIINPSDGTTGSPITVTVQLQDQFGNLITTGADAGKDVTLNTNGSATGGGVVDIIVGTGSLNISDSVAQTVDLSLTDSGGTGFTTASTQDVIFAAPPTPRASSLTGSPSSSDYTATTTFTYTPACTVQEGETLTSCATQVSTSTGSIWTEISTATSSDQTYVMTNGLSYRFRTVETDSGDAITSASVPSADDIQVDTAAPTPNPPTITTSGLSQTSITWTLSTASDAGVGPHATPYGFATSSGGPYTYLDTPIWVENSLTCGTKYRRYGVIRDALGNQTSEATAISATARCHNTKTPPVKKKLTVNDFIVYGTPTTQRLDVKKRAAVIDFYYQAYGKLPDTEAEWSDVLKIASGRWPNERSVKAENRAKLEFVKVYRRNANLKNNIDENALMIIAYGLLPLQRNLASEATAIQTFRWVYEYSPVSALSWSVVQAIAYSGAKR